MRKSNIKLGEGSYKLLHNSLALQLPFSDCEIIKGYGMVIGELAVTGEEVKLTLNKDFIAIKPLIDPCLKISLYKQDDNEEAFIDMGIANYGRLRYGYYSLNEIIAYSVDYMALIRELDPKGGYYNLPVLGLMEEVDRFKEDGIEYEVWSIPSLQVKVAREIAYTSYGNRVGSYWQEVKQAPIPYPQFQYLFI
jgi:hypothetical protein